MMYKVMFSVNSDIIVDAKTELEAMKKVEDSARRTLADCASFEIKSVEEVTE